MTTFIFADEAGNFTFRRIQGASRYFLVCTLTTHDCALSSDLLALRRRLAAEGDTARDKLHAQSDLQAVRDEVFDLLSPHEFRVDATLLEKCKTPPALRPDEPSFYRLAWERHLARLDLDLSPPPERALVTAASIGTNKTRAAFKLAVNNAMQAAVTRSQWQVVFMDSANDPLLWAADYCAWAIQRKWERQDERSHRLIARKIASEVDLWGDDPDRYY